MPLEDFLRERLEIPVSHVFSYAITIDKKSTYSLEDVQTIGQQLAAIARENGQTKFAGDLEKALSSISSKDAEVQTDNKTFFGALEFGLANAILEENINYALQESTGGGAAYSYRSAKKVHEKNKNQHVFFVGNLPRTVLDFLLSRSAEFGNEYASDLLKYSTKRPEFDPRTHSLEIRETSTKLMLSLIEGRRPEDLDFEDVARKVNLLYGNGDDLYIVQLGSLNKGEPSFHRTTKSVFEEASARTGKQTIFYAGTSDFKDDTNRVIEILKVVYSAHILSMNEKELDQVYSALYNTGASESALSRAEKLSVLDNLVESYNSSHNGDIIEINPEQIKICHSAHGAIAYKNSWHGDSNKQLAQELLQLCVDGTTIKYETDNYLCLRDILAYSGSSGIVRQNSGFGEKFGDEQNKDNHEVVSAVAPVVPNPIGTLTGLGGAFDGIATSTMGLYFAR